MLDLKQTQKVKFTAWPGVSQAVNKWNNDLQTFKNELLKADKWILKGKWSAAIHSHIVWYNKSLSNLDAFKAKRVGLNRITGAGGGVGWPWQAT